MRKITFVASVLCFMIVVSSIITGSWKDVSIARERQDDVVVIETKNIGNNLLEIENIGEKLKETKPGVQEDDNKKSILENKNSISQKEDSDKKSSVKSEKNYRSLFIGDSRTVGIAEYAGIKNVDFYANVGLSVYNIFKDKATVKGIGSIGIDKLLESKKYGKIYLMIGINELGYDFNKSISKYRELVSYIHNMQPDANIILQANLHVTKERAQGDEIINNKMIDRYNDAISSMADNEKVFYIDANPVFDDKEGNLISSMTSDGVHILAKYYKKWGEWIVEKTDEL